MLRQLIEAWQQVPAWLRVLIGLQVVAAGCVMQAMSQRVGFGSAGLAGFTIGFGLAIAMLARRGRSSDDDATDGDRK